MNSYGFSDEALPVLRHPSGMTGVPSPASSVTSQGGASDTGASARAGTPSGPDAGRLSQSGTPEPRSGGVSPMPPPSPKERMLMSPTGSHSPRSELVKMSEMSWKKQKSGRGGRNSEDGER